MGKSESIWMTKEGYEQQLQKLDDLIKKFNENSFNKSKAIQDAVGDGWHDNFQFEELNRQEVNLANQIKVLSEKIKNIKIIERKNNIDNDLIDIGDKLIVELIYSDGDSEILNVILLGEECNCLNDKITINSPLGRSIYNKKVGQLISCQINGNNVNVKIIKKL